MTLCTCNVTDRLLVNVTPRILIFCTRWSSGISSGIENFVFLSDSGVPGGPLPDAAAVGEHPTLSAARRPSTPRPGATSRDFAPEVGQQRRRQSIPPFNLRNLTLGGCLDEVNSSNLTPKTTNLTLFNVQSKADMCQGAFLSGFRTPRMSLILYWFQERPIDILVKNRKILYNILSHRSSTIPVSCQPWQGRHSHCQCH